MEVSLADALITLGVGAGVVVAILCLFAVPALYELTVHDLKIETRRLQAEYAERLAKLRSQSPG